MWSAFTIERWILYVLWVFVMVLQVWAFVDCLTRKTAAFPAVNKLSKPAWLAFTGFAGVLQGLLTGNNPTNLLGLIALIVALVYLADVRPAVREITGPSRW